MTPHTLEELLWRESDGELSTRERRELERLLAAEPEPERLRQQIASVDGLLAGIESEPPPPELRGRIDAALAREAAHGARARSLGTLWSRAGDWFGGTGSRGRFAYAAAAILVVAFGAGLLYRTGSESISGGDVVGTIGTAERAAGLVIETGDDFEVFVERQGANRLVVTVSTESARALSVNVSREPEPSPATGSIRLHGPGSARIEVGSAEGQAGVWILVRSEDGETLLERRVDVAELP